MHKTLSLPRPDDWHLHLRDGAMMASVLASSTDHFVRALIMPNLVPPVVTGAEAQAYKTRIMAQLPERSDFSPLMTLYLTEATDPEDLAKAFQSGLISAVKLYPAGATTNSASGVTDFKAVQPALEKMTEIGYIVGLIITKVSIKYSCTQDFLLTFTIEKPVDLNLAGKC